MIDLHILINKNKYLYDLFRLIFIFGISVILSYFGGSFLSRLLFILYFALFIRSKNDYFWLAFFIIISLSPGGLFPSGTWDTYGRLPLFSFGRRLSFTIFEIFTIIAVLKARSTKNLIYQFPFKRELLLIFLFIIFLLAYSFLLGISIDKIILTFRYLFPLSYFYIIPKLLTKSEDYLYFILLCLPFSIFDFAGQLYQLATGGKFLLKDNMLSPSELDKKFETLGGFRTKISPYLNLISFIFSLFLTLLKKLRFRYLFFSIAIINYISIILVSTRGWIIGYSVIMLLFIFFLIIKNTTLSLKILLSGILLISTIFIFIPLIKLQAGKAFERLSTIERLIEGDISAGGTLSRLNERSPRVMTKFYESPLIGFGFSDEGYKYSDAHVGNQNILREGGIIEAFLILYFIIIFIIKLVLTRKNLQNTNFLKDSLFIFIIGLIGIFIIHSSSVQIFGFALGFQSRIFLAVFFMFAGYFINLAIKLEYSI